ncbi:hydroxyacylglutathione hydrolase [Paragemmobacter straminiformis]|uniref:Hydroxyacylglutathione hydrolase n=1 Tax=Paragemmobacter straminiformis TaxID=2045119 RepID=A0A842I641_9RHOB|nr:hydroxyacylglutathione hydrolase [Gemmobacter straminiformis]MBC2834883.1 hydroxyacylglutathione hydrolase [Gemmobacter straminiformis]
MPLELVTIPCLKDNYAYLIHDPETGETAVVDVPEAAPILAALGQRGWRLTDIWLTHHHWDHIDGVPALRDATGALVTGAAADAHRLPPLDLSLPADGSFTLGRHSVETLEVPGHTVGHIAFHIPAAGLAFTGDSLMAAGCGRLFEGTPDQMHASLQKLARLAPGTLICSGHEYTAANIRFALTLEPSNAALISRADKVATLRAGGHPTVPVTLAEELATNPFLRTHSAEIRANTALGTAPDAKVFAEIRSRKDSF